VFIVSCNFGKKKKTTISHHRMTSADSYARQFWSETFTLVQKFSIQLQLPFPIVVWWRGTSSRTSYVILSNFPSQAHVKTANCAAPPVHRRRWKKYWNLVLFLLVGYVSFANSFILSTILFLGNEMSFKDPIRCDRKLGFDHTSITNSSAS
jgi:hypothetical protein